MGQSPSRVSLASRGQQFTVSINSRPVGAFEGETVAAVLLAEGLRSFRRTPKMSAHRGVFCGIGICYECVVTVNGVPSVRACTTPVTPGMVIEVPER